MNRYYTSTAKEVVDMMRTDVNKGLLEYDCTNRRELHGNNEINLPFDGGNKGILKKVLKQLHLIVAILSLIVFIYSKLYSLALVTLGLIIINIFFTVYHELKKRKELDILYNLNSTTVTIIREGIQRIIPSVELVKGDIVVVKKGSFIGADMRVIEAKDLKVDEKNLTGEEFLKEKYETKMFSKVSAIGEINNMLFRGTLVRDGSGLAVVVATGNETELGKLLTNFVNSDINKHTLYEKIEKKYSKTFICLILVTIILYILLPGKQVDKNIVFSYSLFATISISLPLISMIYSKMLTKKMSIDSVEIRNLSAIDIVKDIEIMFLNKYGNITEEKLNVSKVYTNDEYLDADMCKAEEINFKRLLDISLLTNNSKYSNKSKWEKGSVFEISYAEFAAKKKVFKSVVDGQNIRKFEIPFNSSKNMFTTVTRSRKGFRANSRGNLEEIMETCSFILINGIEREINKKDIENIKLADLSFSRLGLVTEGFAYRSFNYQPSEGENIESHMVFVGIIAHENPIVENVSESLRELVKGGVMPIVFTDENKISAEMIGRKIGLIRNEDEVTSEGELRLLSENDALAKISKTKIFCRVTPEFKNRIISLFKSDGYKIITEGETLGDLPILRNGNISAAKGKATTLLKNISDIYANKSLFDIFRYLKEANEELFKLVDATIINYSMFILAQIVVLNLGFLINKDIAVTTYFIIISNLLLLTPLLIFTLISGKNERNTKQSVGSYSLFIISAISGMILVEGNLELAVYIITGANLIVHALISSEKKLSDGFELKKSLLITVAIYVLGGVILYLITKPMLTSNQIIIVGVIIIIYIVGEIFLKSWQE